MSVTCRNKLQLAPVGVAQVPVGGIFLCIPPNYSRLAAEESQWSGHCRCLCFLFSQRKLLCTLLCPLSSSIPLSFAYKLSPYVLTHIAATSDCMSIVKSIQEAQGYRRRPLGHTTNGILHSPNSFYVPPVDKIASRTPDIGPIPMNIHIYEH